MTNIVLTPGFDRRERVIVYGPPGSGKSFAWQTILAASHPSTTFYVIDTDGAWEPAASSPEFAPHAHRVRHYEPLDWREFLNNVDEIARKMTKDDWYIVDLADKAWDEAQEFYAERKYDNDIDILISGDDEDPQSKWGTINSLYKPFARSLVRCPGNVFLCATEKELKKDSRGNYFRESRQHVRDFGSIGAKPGGQKNLPYDVNTVIHMRVTGLGRQFEVVKDRNREAKWGDQKVRDYSEDFSRDFLMTIAGWRPQVMPDPESETTTTPEGT